MKKKEPILSVEDLELLAKTIGRPAPADVKAKVFAKIDQIDRDISAGKIKTTPANEIERMPKRPEGRDGIE